MEEEEEEEEAKRQLRSGDSACYWLATRPSPRFDTTFINQHEQQMEYIENDIMFRLIDCAYRQTNENDHVSTYDR
jgi:hypothetical protein